MFILFVFGTGYAVGSLGFVIGAGRFHADEDSLVAAAAAHL